MPKKFRSGWEATKRMKMYFPNETETRAETLEGTNVSEIEKMRTILLTIISNKYLNWSESGRQRPLDSKIVKELHEEVGACREANGTVLCMSVRKQASLVGLGRQGKEVTISNKIIQFVPSNYLLTRELEGSQCHINFKKGSRGKPGTYRLSS